MKNLLATSIVLFFTTIMMNPVFGFDHEHSLFNKVLQKNVRVTHLKSQVNYDQIKKNPKNFQEYLKIIEAVSGKEYQAWDEPKQIAFLVNAYNALTIQLILTKYPDLESIKDLGGFFSSPWKKEFFTLFGKKMNLDFIEHKILRKEFNEPRIHFAVVCASIGCPPLRNEAYRHDKLESQFRDIVKNFMEDPDNNRYDGKKKTLYLSSIFKWFKEDFEKSTGSVEAFVAPWITSNPEEQKMIVAKKVSIEYVDWDWSLNKVK